MAAAWVSLADTQRLSPDEQHYDSTVETFAEAGGDEFDDLWSLEKVPVAGIDPFQLIDDPSDLESLNKVRGIRQTISRGQVLPPVYVMHVVDAHPYWLFEGQHRYNAAYEERQATMLAWVGHLQCGCTNPAAVVEAEGDG